MESRTHFRHGIANPILQEAYLVFHHPISFHAAAWVLNTASKCGSIMSCYLAVKSPRPDCCAYTEPHKIDTVRSSCGTVDIP